MPDGRARGFVIAKGDFGQLLSDVPKDAKIGKDLQSPVTAVEVAGLIEKHRKDEIFIEEQDGTWHILHFNPWISVDESSPLFSTLRQCHVQWVQGQISDSDKQR